MDKLRFAYGNTYETVANPQPARSHKHKKNSHRWCMFVSLNDSPALTSKYIRQVTYHLDPTFRPATVVLKEAPFLLSRVGYEEFEVEIDVEFQPETGLPPRHLTHELIFEPHGQTKSILLQAD